MAITINKATVEAAGKILVMVGGVLLMAVSNGLGPTVTTIMGALGTVRH